MKLNLYDAFDLISEEAVSLLNEYDGIPETVQDFSAETTIQAVLENSPKSMKKLRQKTAWKVRLLIAAAIITALSSISLAIYEGNLRRIHGAELVDETNRDLVGKEMSGIAIVTDSEGNIVNKDELYEAYGDLCILPDGIQAPKDMPNWKHSETLTISHPLIREVQPDTCMPRSISAFAVQEKDEKFFTPEVIFVNGVMVIFTKEDGSGWHLDEGESLKLEVEEYPSEINSGRGQFVSYQYIFNGTLMGKDFPDTLSLNLSYEITADEAGEYYPCIINASSDPITLKEGEIVAE